MKKQLLMVALFVSLAAGTASAEISTNLQVRKEFNGKGKPTLVTFVDDEGNPVTAENGTIRWARSLKSGMWM